LRAKGNISDKSDKKTLRGKASAKANIALAQREFLSKSVALAFPNLALEISLTKEGSRIR
jgi:hypothetical protein